MVTCNDCKNFKLDPIGGAHGAGIGSCARGAKSTNEPHGKLPLYRYAPRRCAWFAARAVDVQRGE